MGVAKLPELTCTSLLAVAKSLFQSKKIPVNQVNLARRPHLLLNGIQEQTIRRPQLGLVIRDLQERCSTDSRRE